MEKEILEIDNKVSRLLDMQLENTILTSEYKEKKEKILNQKADLKQKLLNFERKRNYWLEPMRNFILSAHQANFLINSENLEERLLELDSPKQKRQLGTAQRVGADAFKIAIFRLERVGGILLAPTRSLGASHKKSCVRSLFTRALRLPLTKKSQTKIKTSLLGRFLFYLSG